MINLDESKVHNWIVKIDLLNEAITHPNYHSIDPKQANFERLEFLGDAVLDVLSAEWLYKNIDEDVGVLSKLRSLLVQTNTLADVGREIELDKIMLVEPYYRVEKTDIEDCLEAIFGAFYLSNGLEKTRLFFNLLFIERLEQFKKDLKDNIKRDEILDLLICEKNPVNSLQEFCQKERLDLPEYNVLRKEGTDHDPVFFVECLISLDKQILRGLGEGRNLKTARSEAAKHLIDQLERLEII